MKAEKQVPRRDAQQAQRLADAFGLKVPMAPRKPAVRKAG
jgi:hypothetical protein